MDLKNLKKLACVFYISIKSNLTQADPNLDILLATSKIMSMLFKDCNNKLNDLLTS